MDDARKLASSNKEEFLIGGAFVVIEQKLW